MAGSGEGGNVVAQRADGVLAAEGDAVASGGVRKCGVGAVFGWL